MEPSLIFTLQSLKSNQFLCSHFLAALQLWHTSWLQCRDLGKGVHAVLKIQRGSEEGLQGDYYSKRRQRGD